MHAVSFTVWYVLCNIDVHNAVRFIEGWVCLCGVRVPHRVEVSWICRMTPGPTNQPHLNFPGIVLL